MLRYVSVLWDATDPYTSQRAADAGKKLDRLSNGWQRIFSAPGLMVFTDLGRASYAAIYTLPAEAGIILGRLFPTVARTTACTQTPLVDEAAALRMVETSGAHLIQRYWGAYVAFMRNATGSHALAIRDCSGKIPCYRTSHSGVHICCADLSDLEQAGLRSFTTNWQYLAAFIYVPRLQIRDCAFKEVTELLAGDCFEIRQRVVRQFSAWDPGKICDSGWISDYADARSVMRATTQYCIDSWASHFLSLAVRASGGLDSSIVLGCLSKSANRPKIICINEYADNTNDDERKYARLATSLAGVRLVEHLREPTKPALDSVLIAAQRTGKPSISSLERANEIDPINQIVSKESAQSVWTGQGGDHLFYQMKTTFGAADHFSHSGFGGNFLGSVRDAAHLSREPYYAVFRDAVRLARRRQRWTPPLLLVSKPYFVNPDLVRGDIQEYVTTPWASSVQHLPKGKQYQIQLLAECLNRHRTMPGLELAEEHHPLQSQPLMELCLKIPSYVLQKGGRQRALARDAFGDVLPNAIAGREDKGETEWFVREFIRRNELPIREAVLDGALVRERIVIRSELEPFLMKRQPMRTEQYWALLACLASELFLRSWSERPGRAAA
ncbi:MAG TPA: asparagine synthase C-terminal domain-containing protein [Steroidobacteraceae bacterium]|jgi:asparagine synthase (glutamine-hydrolysing)